AGLGRGDQHAGPLGLGARPAAGADRVHLDTAALLGAGDLPPRRLRARAGADVAGDPRRAVHALADPALHRAAVRGDDAAGDRRHERLVLPRRRDRARRGVPLVRVETDGPAGRILRHARVRLLGGVPDGAVRVPAARPLAVAVAGAGGGAAVRTCLIGAANRRAYQRPTLPG